MPFCILNHINRDMGVTVVLNCGLCELLYLIQYKKVVVPGKDKNNLASNAATWHK
jgi:hypothetical protein